MLAFSLLLSFKKQLQFWRYVRSTKAVVVVAVVAVVVVVVVVVLVWEARKSHSEKLFWGLKTGPEIKVETIDNNQMKTSVKTLWTNSVFISLLDNTSKHKWKQCVFVSWLDNTSKINMKTQCLIHVRTYQVRQHKQNHGSNFPFLFSKTLYMFEHTMYGNTSKNNSRAFLFVSKNAMHVRTYHVRRQSLLELSFLPSESLNLFEHTMYDNTGAVRRDMRI